MRIGVEMKPKCPSHVASMHSPSTSRSSPLPGWRSLPGSTRAPSPASPSKVSLNRSRAQIPSGQTVHRHISSNAGMRATAPATPASYCREESSSSSPHIPRSSYGARPQTTGSAAASPSTEATSPREFDFGKEWQKAITLQRLAAQAGSCAAPHANSARAKPASSSSCTLPAARQVMAGASNSVTAPPAVSSPQERRAASTFSRTTPRSPFSPGTPAQKRTLSKPSPVASDGSISSASTNVPGDPVSPAEFSSKGSSTASSITAPAVSSRSIEAEAGTCPSLLTAHVKPMGPPDSICRFGPPDSICRFTPRSNETNAEARPGAKTQSAQSDSMVMNGNEPAESSGGLRDWMVTDHGRHQERLPPRLGDFQRGVPTEKPKTPPAELTTSPGKKLSTHSVQRAASSAQARDQAVPPLPSGACFSKATLSETKRKPPPGVTREDPSKSTPSKSKVAPARTMSRESAKRVESAVMELEMVEQQAYQLQKTIARRKQIKNATPQNCDASKIVAHYESVLADHQSRIAELTAIIQSNTAAAGA